MLPKIIRLLLAVLFISSICFAEITSTLDEFGKNPTFGVSEFRKNKILRIHREHGAIEFKDKQIGSHIVVVGLPDSDIPLKEPVIIAGGFLSSQQGYVDVAEGYKKLGHPVFLISPPGHGANDTADATPMFMGDRHFVDSYALKIESTVDFAREMFPDKKVILTGHSLGGIASSLFTYGVTFDKRSGKIKQSNWVARKRWRQLAGVIYKNAPLMIETSTNMEDETTEKAMRAIGPALRNSDFVKQSASFRRFFDSPTVGYIPRLIAAYFSELTFWGTKKYNEEAMKGLITADEVSVGDISRLIHSTGTTTNLPEGVKFSLLIGALTDKWCPTQPIYAQLIKEGVLRANSRTDLKVFNQFLIESVEKGQTSFTVDGAKVFSIDKIAKIVNKVVDEQADLEKVIKQPKKIGPISAKPNEAALIADDDPLGNSEVMTRVFSDGKNKRRVYRNNKGHLGVMFHGHAHNEQRYIVEGLIEDYSTRDFIDLDNHFPPQKTKKRSCIDIIRMFLSL